LKSSLLSFALNTRLPVGVGEPRSNLAMKPKFAFLPRTSGIFDDAVVVKIHPPPVTDCPGCSWTVNSRVAGVNRSLPMKSIRRSLGPKASGRSSASSRIRPRASVWTQMDFVPRETRTDCGSLVPPTPRIATTALAPTCRVVWLGISVGVARAIVNGAAVAEPRCVASSSNATATTVSPGAVAMMNIALALPFASVVTVARERPSVNVTGRPARPPAAPESWA